MKAKENSVHELAGRYNTESTTNTCESFSVLKNIVKIHSNVSKRVIYIKILIPKFKQKN